MGYATVFLIAFITYFIITAILPFRLASAIILITVDVVTNTCMALSLIRLFSIVLVLLPFSALDARFKAYTGKASYLATSLGQLGPVQKGFVGRFGVLDYLPGRNGNCERFRLLNHVKFTA